MNAMRFLVGASLLATFSLAAAKPDAVVAADGSGQYRSIQEAVSAAPLRTGESDPVWTIYVKAGTYRERVYVQRERGRILVVGEDAARTVLEFDLHANLPGPEGKPIGTFRTPTLHVDGDGFELRNLTVRNTAGRPGPRSAGPDVAQALALRVDGDRVVFRGCRFLGWQDTILVNRGRHWFVDCYIEGSVDFIFGAATAYFSRCHIHCVGDGYITAASTPQGQAHGLVFADCRITGAGGVKTWLGRPWREFAATTFLRTEMGAVVHPAGWHNWNKPHAEKTARYVEFATTGPGANPASRVSWSRQLTAAEAERYTIAAVLGGTDGWNPAVSLAPVAAPDVWRADLGDGTYRNPIIHADYSDPDAIRVGDDYWMTSSSFSHVPGLPILHSRDLVNWSLTGHALPRLGPGDFFRTPQHGKGVWAPAFRHHAGKFWIYYPDPDHGLYVTTAEKPTGPWSAPVLVKAGKGLIDPCPVWLDDGRVYLIHAWAKSRAGFNNVLTLLRLDATGTRVEEDLGVVIDGNKLPGYTTLEGPKFYRRDGWFYVFAPAGGVKSGWQSVFRSRDIRGPYEARLVLAQGTTPVNGPHQGALVDTPAGDWWFLHFQDKDAYGRIVHLQPVVWRDGWPVIGRDTDGDGTGEPLLIAAKPALPSRSPVEPATSDDFDGPSLGLQWQWQANPSGGWTSLTARPGWLRLAAQPRAANLWSAPWLLLQKFPAPVFTATTVVDPTGLAAPGEAGLVVFGTDYAWIGVRRTADGLRLVCVERRGAMDGGTETIAEGPAAGGRIWLRVEVSADARCRFSYSVDEGGNFAPLGGEFTAQPGRWVGAKVGLFAQGPPLAAQMPFADFQFFAVLPPAGGSQP